MVGGAASALPERRFCQFGAPHASCCRLPCRENTQSCERLSFEEFSRFEGKQDYLWEQGGCWRASP